MTYTLALWCDITGPDGENGPVQWAYAHSEVELLADRDVEWRRVLHGFDAATSALIAKGVLVEAGAEDGYPLFAPIPEVAEAYHRTLDISDTMEAAR